jgi:hypothetical protein
MCTNDSWQAGLHSSAGITTQWKKNVFPRYALIHSHGLSRSSELLQLLLQFFHVLLCRPLICRTLHGLRRLLAVLKQLWLLLLLPLLLLLLLPLLSHFICLLLLLQLERHLETEQQLSLGHEHEGGWKEVRGHTRVHCLGLIIKFQLQLSSS